jgi:hypothetical protein
MEEDGRQQQLRKHGDQLPGVLCGKQLAYAA